MAREEIRNIESVDSADTARIDRRGTILAQIEAALLANKLSVLELTEERTGTDPYNRSRSPATGVWSHKRVR
jgi:hypothetical protein